MNNILTKLKNLQQAFSPSGYEEKRLHMFHQLISPYVDCVKTDLLGNTYGIKYGTSNLSIMLIAHADEIGLLIHHIDESGFLHFHPIGGTDSAILPSHKVLIQGNTDTIYGIIGKKPIHMQGEDVGSKYNFEDMWIDIGVKSKEEALNLVSIGSVAVLDSEIACLNNDNICGRALDDCAGLAVLISVAEYFQVHQTEYNIIYVASVQEEIGSRGAQIIATRLKPNIAIAIDVAHTTDYPTISPIKYGDIQLGKGAVISIGPNIDKSISARLISIAKEHNLCFQIEAQAFPSGTDAREIQVRDCGIATGILSIPCRYMHTPVESISIKDLQSVISIIIQYCK